MPRPLTSTPVAAMKISSMPARRVQASVILLLFLAAVCFIVMTGKSDGDESDSIVSASQSIATLQAEDFDLESSFKRLGILPTDLIRFSSTCDSKAYAHRSTLQKRLNISTPSSRALRSSDARLIVLDQVFDGISPFQDFPHPAFKPLIEDAVRLRGWGSTSPVFSRLINETRPDIVIEVGSFMGASAIHMARVSKSLGLNPLILCLDDFRGWPAFHKATRNLKQQNGDVMLLQTFLKNVQSGGHDDVILPVPYSTAHTLTALCHWGVQADLIEVDAGHDFHSAWIDINLAHRLLKPGGVMFGHDYFAKGDSAGVRRAVTLFARLNGYDVQPDGEHWVLRSVTEVREEGPRVINVDREVPAGES